MGNHLTDVIVAPASGAGRSAVAVVRLSGGGSASMVHALCGSRFEPDRRMHLVWLRHPESGRRLDQAMVVFYAAGASFTGEESVEIFCHGGPVIVDSIVRACIDLGASHAGPGDFTRRAVANGRLDLVQAEAVALLTESSNEIAADVAIQALGGHSSERLSALSSRLLDMLADCEASLDFDERDEVYVDISGLGAGLSSCIGMIDGWIRDARSVRPAVSGFRVALSGRPNVGKSTLFNALTGQDLAIVHDQPGTTRDVISEHLALAGVACVLLDTAGVRDMAGEVEAEGVRRALKAASDADMVLHVIESGSGYAGASDFPGIRQGTTGQLHAIVFSKSDLVDRPDGASTFEGDIPVFTVSVRNKTGVDELRNFIASCAVEAVRSAGHVAAVVAGERQTMALNEARAHLAGTGHALDLGAPLEVVASGIRAAVQSLGEITGSRITEEVLDRIFLKFCIGK